MLLRLGFLAIVATYAQTLRFDFVYDDHSLIELSPWMQSWKYILVVFRKSFWGLDEWQRTAHYYRPMVTALLIFVRQIFGPLPAWFHLVVLAVHLLATYLTFALVRRLLGRSDIALLSAGIFGLHPTKAESVAWISGVSDPLGLVFLLASALAYLKGRDPERLSWQIGSAAFLFLGILSKEVVIFGVLVFVLHEFTRNAGSIARRAERTLRKIWPHAIAIGTALAVRSYVLRNMQAPETAADVRLYTLWSAPAAFLWYLKQQILPAHVSVQYPLLIVRGFSLAGFVFSLFAVVAFLVTLLWLTRRSPAAQFFVAWGVFTICPVIAFHVVIQLHDRYAYIPSVATSVGLSYLILRPTEGRARVRLTVIAVLLAGLVTSSLYQVSFWKDDITVFEHAAQVGYDHPDAYAGLVTAYADQGRTKEQRAAIERWIANTPDSPYRGWYAMFLYEIGQHDPLAAQRAFENARPGLTQTRVNLGLGTLAMAQGRCVDAERYYRLTVAQHPDAVELHTKLAAAIGCQGRKPQALEELKVAWKLRDQVVE
jgi:tetratricopeptide (TPR) repeat protein